MFMWTVPKRRGQKRGTPRLQSFDETLAEINSKPVSNWPQYNLNPYLRQPTTGVPLRQVVGSRVGVNLHTTSAAAERRDCWEGQMHQDGRKFASP
jgi:hypothetical protein